MFTLPTQDKTSMPLALLVVAGLLIAAAPVLAGPPDVTDTATHRSAQIQSELAAALAEIEASKTLVKANC